MPLGFATLGKKTIVHLSSVDAKEFAIHPAPTTIPEIGCATIARLRMTL